MAVVIFIWYLLAISVVSGKLLFSEKNILTHNLGEGDDESHSVRIKKAITFWDEDLKTFQVSFNGGILQKKYNRIILDDPWESFNDYSIFPLWGDVRFRKEDCQDCGLFYKNDSFLPEHMSKINSLLQVENFVADKDRTLVVTWYNAPSYQRRPIGGYYTNTFQAVLTSNGMKSYLIVSYEQLQYPIQPKIGYYVNSSNYCKLTGGDPYLLRSLTCRSNINKPGVFVFGLTENTRFKCNDDLLMEYSCSECVDDVDINRCDEIVITTLPTEATTTARDTTTTARDTTTTATDTTTTATDTTTKVTGTTIQSTQSTNTPTTRNCLVHNGGCEDICTNIRCMCQVGELESNQFSCNYDSLLYFGAEATFHLFNIKTDQYIINGNILNDRITSVSHDYQNKRIFFSDNKFGRSDISVMFINGKGKKVIYTERDIVEGVLYDWQHGNLYYATLEGDVSLIIDVDNKTRNGSTRSLLFTLSKPRALAMDYCERLLFISDWENGSIVQYTDDHGPKVIVSNLRFPNALAIDKENKKIYWNDAGRAVIETANYDGSCKRVLTTIPGEFPYGMAYADGGLYWTNQFINPVNHKFYLMLTDIETGVSSYYKDIGFRKPFAVGVFEPQDLVGCGKLPSCTPIYPPAVCYEYGEDVGDKVVERSDDTGYGLLELDQPVALFQNLKEKVFININGHISIGEADNSTAISFPYNKNSIAAYATDLLTETVGDIYYRETKHPAILEEITQDVRREYLNDGFVPTTAIIVTYLLVPSYSLLNQRNTFQLIIGSNITHSYLIWCFGHLDDQLGTVGYYESNCNWEQLKYDAATLVQRRKFVRSTLQNKCQSTVTPPQSTTTRPPNTISAAMFPFGTNVNDYHLEFGDDTKVTLNLTEGFLFLSKKVDNLIISTDGFITTTKRNLDHLGDSDSHPMIFIYAKNFDTSSGNRGKVYYRLSNQTDDYKRVNQEIQFFLENYANEDTIDKSFQARNILIVTYDEVQEYSTQKQNTFQLVFAYDDNSAYGIFKYNYVESVNAKIGYFESQCNTYKLPQSHTDNSDSITRQSNVNINGKFIFKLSKLSCFIENEVEVKSVSDFTSSLGIISPNLQVKEVSSVTVILTQMVNEKGISNSFLADYYTAANNSLKVFIPYSMFSFDDNNVSNIADHQLMLVNSYMPVTENFIFGKFKLPNFYSNVHCYEHQFPIMMSSVPIIKVTVDINLQTAFYLPFTLIWIRNVTIESFHVCYEEMIKFSGSKNLTINYVAISKNVSGITEYGKIQLLNGELPPMQQTQNARFCQNLYFSQTYSSKPYVFVTPEEDSDDIGGTFIAWVHSIGKTSAVVCGKSSHDTAGQRLKKMKVHYIVKGIIDRCQDFHCPTNQECHLSSNGTPYCGCLKSCLSTDHNIVCGTDFVTYKNLCSMYKEYCEVYGVEALGNISIANQGECHTQPYESGKIKLDPVPGVPVAFCKYITLDKTKFSPIVPMHILITVIWDDMMTQLIHEASATWSEDVTTTGFKACVMVAGRHFFDVIDSPSIYWFAFQVGMTKARHLSLESGLVHMKTWYTGSRCQTIPIQNGTLNTKVYVSVEHAASRTFSDAVTAWVEVYHKYNSSDFRVCARELQNFDGSHVGVKLHWLAVHKPTSNFIRKVEDISFTFPNVENMKGHCKIIPHTISDAKAVIILTPQNRTHIAAATFSQLDIVSWIEFINGTHINLCVKSVRASEYEEEATLSYMIFSTHNQILCSLDYCENGGSCFVNVTGKQCNCPPGFVGDRCQYAVPDVYECRVYTIHNEPWRHFNNRWDLQSSNVSCDARLMKNVSNGYWIRFDGLAGTKLLERCPGSYNHCGTEFPGWMDGGHPNTDDGVVRRKIHFYSGYCASDHGAVDVRNCSGYFVYRFTNLPYWSCHYGLCTVP